MKKRIVTLALVVALVAIAAVGTLAYFTDTEVKTNTFTNGQVDIALNDEFEQNSKLLPGIANAVDKVVSVTNNLGSEEAYVRVHIAVPKALNDKIVLGFDDADNWSWAYSSDDQLHHSTPEYEVNIDGVDYVVAVVTYEKKLAASEKTTNVFDWVFMRDEVTEVEGENWNIIVYAEGAQAAGFANAYEALEAAFGTPSNTNNPWNGYNNDAE